MKNTNRVLKELHPLEVKVLLALKGKEKLTSEEIINIARISEAHLRRAAGWLETKKLIKIIKDTKTFVYLTETGKKYYKKGIPEKQIIELIDKKQVVNIKDINLEPTEISKAIGFLKNENIIEIKSGGTLTFKDKTQLEKVNHIQNLIDKAHKGIPLETLAKEDKKIIEERYRERGKGRGMFEITRKQYSTLIITKQGGQVISSLHIKELPLEKISQLTPGLIKDDKWRGKKFREYNIGLKPPRLVIGRKHPYQEFLDKVREKLISMGFCEVEGPLVENEFWNMDALFMPQFHPAREVHGIYFTRHPKYSKKIEPKLLEKVAQTHQNGWRTKSKGWGYKFDKKRAQRLILRSQGTPLSVRTLALHPKPPGKYFAIARCFRPDQIDVTHAADFFQIEGIVIGKNINFRSLLGLLELFGTEIALAKEIRFTPGYFPFTEPSAELHAKHPKLGWVELGGAGMFRPEVTLPLGVKVPVIAWGLGLDRMAMMALNIYDIRDLFSSDLELIRSKTTRVDDPAHSLCAGSSHLMI
ncbi:phenylalanine--tRNA ligase subunit alpha [candidate division WOR-3 bacterium]|nr:phenylalanine--tRNA ligase subunit alpha [candidate division WOR-3 bacterium]